MATKKKMLQAAAGNAGGAGLDITEVFSTYLYEGTGSAQTITNGIDLDGEGGLVWIKNRDFEFDNTLVFKDGSDTLKYLNSASTSAAVGTLGWFSSFNSDGFSITSGEDKVNYSASGYNDYASWTFRKAPKFFDVVTFNNDGNAQTISHNLGSVPGMIIMKRTDAANNWAVYHRSSGGPDKYLYLNTTAGAESNTRFWDNTNPTSTEFTIGNINQAGTYVAYIFAHNDGDGGFGADGDQDIIKCGSFTEGASGASIDLGFEPQFLLFKRSSGISEWYIVDAMRGMPVGGTDVVLNANSSAAEGTIGDSIDLTPTGFNVNPLFGNTQTSIYIAIRRGPLAQPESGTEVFAVDGENTSEPYYTSGFTVDMGLRKRQGSTGPWGVMDRLRQGKKLASDSTNAEVAETDAMFDYMDGMYAAAAYGQDASYGWMWKRAPGFFDVVAYSGNSTAGRTVSHNLGVAPEMMWVKNRSASSNWQVYHKDLNGGTNPANYWLKLNDTDAESALSNKWNDTEPTQSVFSVGNSSTCNASGNNYIAYLFATVPGVSKVGSYTGDGTTDGSKVIDCGFTSSARFVLIKASSHSDPWLVFDSVRGIVSSGNDPYLRLNDTSAEQAGLDVLDPQSSGFGVRGNLTNVNNYTYIFYAIA